MPSAGPIVIVVELCCAIWISRQHNVFDADSDVDGDPTHFGEVAVDLLRQCLRGVAATGELGDMQREGAHPVDIGEV